VIVCTWRQRYHSFCFRKRGVEIMVSKSSRMGGKSAVVVGGEIIHGARMVDLLRVHFRHGDQVRCCARS